MEREESGEDTDRVMVERAMMACVAAVGEYCREYMLKQPSHHGEDERTRFINSIIRDSDRDCVTQLRMNRATFFDLCTHLREKTTLCDTRRVSLEEQLVMFLHTLGHNVRNHVIGHRFIRSGETVSRHFHSVLNAIVSLYPIFVKQVGPTTPTKIQTNTNWAAYFQDCIGAINGTHIPTHVSAGDHASFRNRKGFLSLINVRLQSHPRAVKLCGKRIERMDNLATIVGSNQALGRFVQGSRTIAASTSSSRLQQQLNDAWRELDDDLDDMIDLSNDFVIDSARRMSFSPDSPSIGQHGSRTTPTHTSNSNANQSGSASRKRSRPARPRDVLGASLMTVADSMLKFGLNESVNRTFKVLEILEVVQGLTYSEFFEVGQLLSKDNDLASFFVSLRPERRVDWLKKTLHDHFGDRGVGFI